MTTKEYMPEVGETCEYKLNKSTTWFKCKVKATCNSQGAIVYSGHAFTGEQYLSLNHPDATMFRPIKTKQDLEREEAIEEMGFIIGFAEYSQKMAEKLYDAGYHNEVKVGDEVSLAMFNQYMFQLVRGTTLMDSMEILKHFKIYPREAKVSGTKPFMYTKYWRHV